MNGNGNGVPMPAASHNRSSSGAFQSHQREYSGVGKGGGMGGFVGARSPPKSKNTSHVPCKFYPYGQCQAGAACQFSHDMDPTTQNAPCKYFSKGSCKFGQSCALAHVLPDGRVTNRAPRSSGSGFRRGTGPSLLNAGTPNSLITMQVNNPMAMQEGNGPSLQQQQQEMAAAYGYQPASPPFGPQQIPEVHSPYGSPFGDSRLATSPPRVGLSALDAPMPKSFDSQGVSHAARHGPFAASVPSRFGIESPPASLPNKTQFGSTALRDTTFGDTANLDGVLHGLGSSPGDNSALDFSKRPLHSERFGLRSRPMAMSSSLDIRPNRFNTDTDESDIDSESPPGEDLLPSSLHDLLPPERLRRSSRNELYDESSALPMSSLQRRISSGVTPQDSKTGSLSPHSGSPSRYSAIWAARASNPPKSDNDNSMGPIGSPLRPSNLRASSLNASTSPNSFGQSHISALSSQFQRTNLSDNNRSSQPSMMRNLSSSSNAVRGGLGDRGFSSSSIGREKIDEETMFSMEEDGEGPSHLAGLSDRMSSNGHTNGNGGNLFNLGKSTATLGPIGGQRGSK